MALFTTALGFLGKNWRPLSLGLVGLVVVTMLTLGFRHYTSLVDTVAVLTANEALLKRSIDDQGLAIDAQEETIGEWSDAQDALVKRMDEVQRVATAARGETRRLNEIFSDHDLTELARRKPGLIEPRINAGTARALRLLECASGARGEDCPNRHGATRRDTTTPEPGADTDTTG